MNNNYYYDPQSEAYRQAANRVKAKLGFYWHLASYVIVNGFLITIYLVTSWADNGFYYPWFIWPLLGWGVGLFFNFLAVYVFPDTPASRQRMIEKELSTMGITYPAPTYPYEARPVPTTSNNATEAPVPPQQTPVG